MGALANRAASRWRASFFVRLRQSLSEYAKTVAASAATWLPMSHISVELLLYLLFHLPSHLMGGLSLLLSAEVHTEMWSRVLERLHQGESIVTPAHFEDALVMEYHELTNEALPAPARVQLRELVLELHAQYPETYLAHGVQNAVRQAFVAGIERLDWTPEKIERSGWQVMRRFLRSEPVRDLLADIQMSPVRSMPPARSVRYSIHWSSTRRGRLPAIRKPSVPLLLLQSPSRVQPCVCPSLPNRHAR